jgi:hypothetical protein
MCDKFERPLPRSVLAGARPGAVGLTHSVGPASVAGAIMA